MTTELESAMDSAQIRLELQAQIDKAFQQTHKKKVIDFVLMFNFKTPVQMTTLRLFKSTDGDNPHFATITLKSDWESEELPEDDPFEMPIDGDNISVRSIAEAIPAFLRQHYPEQTQGLPIRLFETLKDFRKQTPSAVINKRREIRITGERVKPIFYNY